MDWKDVLKTMRDKHICAFCGLSLHDLSSNEVKNHLAQKHQEEMLDVFVTCDQTICPECGKDLTPYRVNFVAGLMAKMSI